jgi:homoserine dehydrogenase
MFEASVGGGIPLIAPLRRDLLANRISSIRAIINGTTNYMLTSMAQSGADYADALAQAQQLGYAEPDPRNDVEGYDAAFKLAIMASLGLRARVRPEQIHVEGITRLAGRDFRYAQELGYVIKLLAIARRTDRGVSAQVAPALVPQGEPLARVDGVYNAVEIVGDLTGTVLFMGRGAGADPTTSAVVADLLELAHGMVMGNRDRRTWAPEGDVPILSLAEQETRAYLRVTVSDAPGVLAQIARVLGEHQISIAAVTQKETNQDEGTAELVIMTHRGSEGAVRAALAAIAALDVVTRVDQFLRVEA